MKQPAEGDVFELQTERGLAYLQVTHRDPTMGYLVRCIEGFFSERPINLLELTERSTKLVAFFPVAHAARQKIISRVGDAPVPKLDAAFPLFRVPGEVDRSGRVQSWFLWDGTRSWLVGDLLPKQRSLPIKAVWNDTLLRERIEKGYRPEDDIQQ